MNTGYQPAEGKACLDGVNERSNTRPVGFLVNTHHHGDHTGGSISFKGAAGPTDALTFACGAVVAGS